MEEWQYEVIMSVIFTIRICDVPIEVCCIHEACKNFLANYLTEDKPAMRIDSSWKDIDEMRSLFKKEDPSLLHSDGFLEINAVHKLLCESLLEKDVVMMHGSALAMDGECYIFSAPSGTGKSTHSRLWRQAFGDRVVMINDDKPMIRFIDGKPFVYGTPWDGKHHLSTNASAPLKSIVMIDRGTKNLIEPLADNERLLLLMRQTYRPKDKMKMQKLLVLYDKLISTCRFYHLRCNMEEKAAIIAYEGMKETK